MSFQLSSCDAARFNVPQERLKNFRRRRDVTAGDSSRKGKYYTDSEIAGLLGISLGRLRNKLSAGHPLPPRIQPPGCRNRLWCCEGVHEWLAQFTVTVSSSVHDQVPKRPGRPIKYEVRARRKSASQA